MGVWVYHAKQRNLQGIASADQENHVNTSQRIIESLFARCIFKSVDRDHKVPVIYIYHIINQKQLQTSHIGPRHMKRDIQIDASDIFSQFEALSRLSSLIGSLSLVLFLRSQHFLS